MMLNSFRDVIRLWPNRPQMASDIGTTALVISAWWNRDSIPAAYWDRIVSAAGDRKFEGITLEFLQRLYREKKAGAAA